MTLIVSSGRTIAASSLLFLFLVIGIVLLSHSVGTIPCGTSVNVRRTLSAGVGSSSLPAVNPAVRLISTAVENNISVITISVRDADPTADTSSSKVYYSLDRGVSWDLMRTSARYFTNLPAAGPETDLLMSRADRKVLYYHSGSHPYQYRISTDAGLSWTTAEPTVENGGTISACRLVTTGAKERGRVYAQIEVKELFGRSLCVSNDFGRTYKRLSSGLYYISESGADDSVCYGILNSPRHMLSISLDGGLSWKRLDSSQFMAAPLYRKVFPRSLRTWKEDEGDEELVWPFPILQIETAPDSGGTIYVLTWKGLYRSIDQGVSFVLLPLETQKVLGIDRVAVDPIDGRFVYAGVGVSHIYRSADRGCSWERLSVPM